jgi:hypothetical protein
LGLGIKNTTGNKAKIYRKAANKNGGKLSRETLITTKFVPHTATMASAKNKWLVGSPGCI